MISVTQFGETLRQILEEEANELAKETGFIQRERIITGADFVQTLIFGWLEEPEITLDGFTQIAQRREVEITASGWHQRFTPEAVALMERLTQVRLEAEAAPVALLKRFTAVIVEDSSTISLPDELAELWRGCGGSAGSSQAMLKLFVRWNVLTGDLRGPLLTQGRHADGKSPFNEDEVPAGGLYLADLGFFALWRLQRLSQRRAGRKRYYLLRLPVGTRLYTRAGHQLELRGIVPQQEGAAVELGVLVGKQARVPTRLLLQRVPKEVAEQRRKRIREEAHDHGYEPSEEALYLAGWTIVVSNVPRRLLSLEECLVVLTVRWQIERLFRLWKEDGMIDEWRSKKRWRILCEIYAKLAAMLGGKRPQYPKGRHRDQCRRWPTGKGWASSKQPRKTNLRVGSLT